MRVLEVKATHAQNIFPYSYLINLEAKFFQKLRAWLQVFDFLSAVWSFDFKKYLQEKKNQRLDN